MAEQLELVFVASPKLDEVPFTTSEIIAECAGVSHETVQRLIRRYTADLEEFGVIGFEIRKLNVTEKGGRPEKIFHLNREQATLLLTYMRNTPAVRTFKKNLVKAFFRMERKLKKQAAAREDRKPLRRSMTDAIRDCVPDSPHKKFCYKNYSDLAYRSALGKSARQLREERGVPKDANLAEYLSPDETQAVSKAENQIAVLLELGQEYQSVKNLMLRK